MCDVQKAKKEVECLFQQADNSLRQLNLGSRASEVRNQMVKGKELLLKEAEAHPCNVIKQIDDANRQLAQAKAQAERLIAQIRRYR